MAVLCNVEQWPGGPSPKARCSLGLGVYDSISIFSVLPAPHLPLFGFVCESVFLPTELLLLSYCGGTKPHPCIKLALCVRYKLISGYQGQACPCPDIRIRGRV